MRCMLNMVRIVSGPRRAGGCAGFVMAGLSALVASTAAAQAVLPANVSRSKPAMHIVLDTSGSMYACDGMGANGTITESIDLTPSPSGGYLFNPRTDTSDDGQCNSNSRSSGTYPISRIEAAKLALSKMLDADKNGTINSADEELMGIKMGFTHYDTTDNQYRTSRTRIFPIGTPYATIWSNGVRALQSQGNTPTGPAIAGARALSIANCFDGNTGTFCDLGEKQQSPAGDDLSTCRDYYIVSITDGIPNTNSTTAGVDPVFVSHWIAKRRKFASESAQLNAAWPKLKNVNVRVISVGLGAAVTSPGTEPRASINCTTWWGSSGGNLAADANLDKDSSVVGAATAVNTMDGDTDGSTAGTTLKIADPVPGNIGKSVANTPVCGACTNVGPDPATPSNNAQCADIGTPSDAYYYGNGYFANNSNELLDAMLRIVNAIQAGTFTRSEPVVNPDPVTTTNDDKTYTAMFTVDPNEPLYSGDLQQFRLHPTKGIVHCDTGSEPVAPDTARPCWKAGSLLAGRDFRTRVLYFPNPTDYNAKFNYEKDLFSGAKTNYYKGDASQINRHSYRTVKNFLEGTTGRMSTLPAALSTSWVATNITPGGSTADLYRWAQMASLKTATTTYEPNLTDLVPPESLLATIEAFRFASGNPQAIYSNDKYRSTLQPSKAAPGVTPGPTPALTRTMNKLLDSYNSRPVLVGPPVAMVTDGDYINEFRLRPLHADAGLIEGNSPLSYTGADAPRFGLYNVGLEPNTSYTESQDVATPCRLADMTGTPTYKNCTVSKRRTMAYLAANDGKVHAFDAASGVELWAFAPPAHIYRLAGMRERRTTYIDGVPIVRDVKFPCEREPDGTCKTTTDAYADGKWHTILIYNQGLGGNFFFALDITNPVAPVFLWEFRASDKMGLTVAAATVGEIPTGSTGYGTLTEPGSAVFLPGGLREPDPLLPLAEPHLFTVTVWDGQKMAEKKTDPVDLSQLLTSPGNLVNGLTGAPRAIDGNLDGDVDRVYFGDREGRMWKACAIQPNGDFQVKMFFDPAVYDYHDTDGDGDGDSVAGTGPLGQPLDKSDPTLGLADAEPRKRLRGPLYFSPDITRAQDSELIVVFGSGNILDPLNPPLEYYNFLWSLGDAKDGDGCGPALDNTCTAGTETFTVEWLPITPTPTPTPAPTPPPCPCQAEFFLDGDNDPTFITIIPDETGGFPQCTNSAKPNKLAPPALDIPPPGCRGRSCPISVPPPPLPVSPWDTSCGAGILVYDTSGGAITTDPCGPRSLPAQTGCVWDPTADNGAGDYTCETNCRNADNDTETYCRQTLRDWRRLQSTGSQFQTLCLGPSAGPPAPPALFNTNCGSGTGSEPCGNCRRGDYNNPGYDVFAPPSTELCPPATGGSACSGVSRDYCLSTGTYASGTPNVGMWTWRLRNQLYTIATTAAKPQPDPAIMAGDSCLSDPEDDGTIRVKCDGCSGTERAKHWECEKLQFWYDWNTIPAADCPCAYATPAPTPTPVPPPPPPPPNTTNFAGLIPLRDLLSTPPSIFNKLLFYAEFDIVDTAVSCSAGTFASRLWNRDVFTCGDPPVGTGLFFTSGAPGMKGFEELPNRLVTGIEIVPRTGQMVINASGGGGTPDDRAGPALALQASFAGWRQKW